MKPFGPAPWPVPVPAEDVGHSGSMGVQPVLAIFGLCLRARFKHLLVTFGAF